MNKYKMLCTRCRGGVPVKKIGIAAYCDICESQVGYIFTLKEIKNGRLGYIGSDISPRVGSLGKSKKR